MFQVGLAGNEPVFRRTCKVTRKRSPVRVLSDADTVAVFQARLQRLTLQCSVCLADGWLTTESVAPRAQRIMHFAGCNDHEHVVCTDCLQREADRVLTAAIERRVRADESRPVKVHIPCLYPFDRGGRCSHSYRWSTVRKVASDDVLARFLNPPRVRTSRVLLDGAAAMLACPSCGVPGPVSMETLATNGQQACAGCLAVWCTRCERVDALPATRYMGTFAAALTAACPCRCLADDAVPSVFSRFFTHADGWPKRKREVSRAEVAARKAATQGSSNEPAAKRQRLDEADGKACWHHVACPDCGMGLYKTSACNTLTHCERHVCNVCSCASFPWEPCLPPDHWDASGVDGCPQWDYDPYWNAVDGARCNFRCAEGVCYADGVECTVPAHQGGIHAMHAVRRNQTLAALEREFPPSACVK